MKIKIKIFNDSLEELYKKNTLKFLIAIDEYDLSISLCDYIELCFRKGRVKELICLLKNFEIRFMIEILTLDKHHIITNEGDISYIFRDNLLIASGDSFEVIYDSCLSKIKSRELLSGSKEDLDIEIIFQSKV